jgi:hypothetical protein
MSSFTNLRDFNFVYTALGHQMVIVSKLFYNYVCLCLDLFLRYLMIHVKSQR